MIVQPFPIFLPWYYGLQLLATADDLLAVRCYYVSFRICLLLLTCKTSSGKRYHLHLIYLLHLHLEIRAVLDFILCRILVRFKTPYMQFLFVRPRFCLRLPSDSTSRWTPLPLANSSYCQVCSGLSPPSNSACRAHYKKRKIAWIFLFVFLYGNQMLTSRA